jgi:hypothetical protein
MQFFNKGPLRFNHCGQVDVYDPNRKPQGLKERAFGIASLPRKQISTSRPQPPLSFLPERDCTAIYEPTLEGFIGGPDGSSW